MNTKNKTNGYVESISRSDFDKITKAEFAAVAISHFINREHIEGKAELATAIRNEIQILKNAGIIK